MATESTRDALVRAGVELLESSGSTDVGLREIARRAGVSHGAPRRWFPTHRSLLSAIAEVGLRDFASVVRGAATADDGGDRIREAALAYIGFAVDRPAMFTLIFRHDLLAGGGAEGGGPDLRITSQPLMDWFRDQLDIVDAARRETIAATLWTSIHGIAVLTSTGALGLASPRTSPQSLVDAVLASAPGAVGPTTQAGPLRT